MKVPFHFHSKCRHERNGVRRHLLWIKRDIPEILEEETIDAALGQSSGIIDDPSSNRFQVKLVEGCSRQSRNMEHPNGRFVDAKHLWRLVISPPERARANSLIDFLGKAGNAALKEIDVIPN